MSFKPTHVRCTTTNYWWFSYKKKYRIYQEDDRYYFVYDDDGYCRIIKKVDLKVLGFSLVGPPATIVKNEEENV